MTPLSGFWLVLFICGLAVRTVYEFLKSRKLVNTENKLLFGVIFTAMCLLWVGWFNLYLSGQALLPPLTVGFFIGQGIVLAGIVLFLVALVQLKGLENIRELVTNGLFSRLRHPMYTGFIAWIAGGMMVDATPLTFIPGMAGIASIVYWRSVEEKKLVESFGERYVEYRKRTWF